MLSTLFGLRDKCLRNFKIANIVLKKWAAFNLSLYQIGKITYRSEYGDSPSILEKIVEKSECLYFEVRKRILDQEKIEMLLADVESGWVDPEYEYSPASTTASDTEENSPLVQNVKPRKLSRSLSYTHLSNLTEEGGPS
jgi:hypothetical protein